MSIKLFFGPYECHGLLRHKPERLRGILTELSNRSFHIELIPTKHIERLSVVMRNREVFRCNITYLKYNMDYEDDPIAQKLVAAVQEAHSRMYSESNIPKYFVNKYGMRGIQHIQRGVDPKLVLQPSIELIHLIPCKKARQQKIRN